MSAPALSRAVPRAFTTSTRSTALRSRNHGYRLAHNSANTPNRTSRTWTRSNAVIAAATAVALVYTTTIYDAHAEASDDKPELVIEKIKKKKNATKEENRDLISSQHLQVKKSWENPGVYAWGSNSGRVVAPDSDEAYVKTPRRIPFFDDILLRDLKLDRQFGAAILENGDLVQWGKGYSEDLPTTPTITLRGKDLKQLILSRDRIIALSKSGKVYSVPVSRTDQLEQPKPSESSWIPFWGSTSKISYRIIAPKLSYNERVTTLAGGLEHILMLTSSGRVFSAASSMEGFPSKGQLGVPGVTWLTRPTGPFDMPHEITTLKGFDIVSVAAGDAHSLALDREGRVFAFGDNSSGQLGMYSGSESPYIDIPSLMATNKLYSGTNQLARVTSIAAGGQNSFFTVDATRFAGADEDPRSLATLGRVTADTFSCGTGLRGTLGNGRWTHIQDTPTRIPSLSGLFEYDEVNRVTIPIRLASISAGSTHASATLDNVTYLKASDKSSENDTNWGADCLWWGGNEYYQLGTGRRNNVANPVYIRPLDMEAEVTQGRREEHRFHITPRSEVKVKGRRVWMEQRVECGRGVTGVYSGV